MFLKSVGIIGTGCLGEHIAKMLIRRPSLSLKPISVIGSYRDYARRQELGDIFGPKMVLQRENILVAKCSDVLIISVKPGQVKDVCEEINQIRNLPIICTAAAVPLDKLHEWVSSSQIIIRCMPNIPCSIGHGVVAYYSKHPDANKIMNEIFAPNLVISVDNDLQVDTSTLISGCGPAFFAWYAKCLKQIVTSENPISDDVINQMIIQTMIGTANMMRTNTCDEIIQTVASPKGATEATLDSFRSNGIDKEIIKALIVAQKRINSIATSL